MKLFSRSWALAILCLFALNACSLTPTYKQPKRAMPTEWDTQQPAESAAAVGTAVPATIDWWTRFASPELNELMNEALAVNHDLAAATARIEQARASARIARSRLLPQGVVSAAGSRSKQTESGDIVHYSADEAAVDVSYEIDFWGGNAAGTVAARARLAASTYDRDAVRLILQADVASTYFQALALKDRLAISLKNIESARKLLSLVQSRYGNGAANGLDVAQQRTALFALEAEVPELTQSLNETQSALAVLLGRAPQGFSVNGKSLSELQLPLVDAGQPAELLTRRPDIAAAEANLVAANADVGAARAALYPSLSIGASAAASGWLSGGSGSLLTLAGSLVHTLFDGGALRGQVALNESAREELAETYLQTLLTSLQEAHDSLSAISTAQNRSDLLRQTAEQAREAYRLAGVRYDAGTDDLLSLLTSQQSLLSAEDNLAQARLTTFSATATLFKALGGGWSSGA